MWVQQAFWIFAAVAGVVWFFLPYLKPVGGRWSDPDNEAPWDLLQLGPWVFGEQRHPKGLHKFKGRYKSGVWRIARMDVGTALFEAQGFPPLIAQQLSGRTMVTYLLERDEKGATLQGTMTPMKVIFVKFPPQVSKMVPEAPKKVILTKKD